ncbi:tripartite tricarboxylate transporter substrate binding protein [Noviherbaspirillum sp. CPCC 100848]|uniref:Tripartite tricarboxylate transporter substrate binding protein n=1 Tax=Noviherbaspirillum album TaxID=3080276 RepID=A0ABU6JHX7_9BURK|nr:tripartite tricarboxylate transporter substrate binding protein [Noviherbaspirillum sp. CPCC 100848]MEC4723275.1 tripartite tricarboxylate transporter substrate binding protein [Noviherbaspirillum sp. CPCC 100848]
MIFRKLILASLLLAAASASMADTWPSKPIRFVVAAPGGSSLDVIARTISDKLKDRLGQPIVIENIPGGAGTIATGNVARAAPDGHTWVMSYNGPLAYTQFLTRLPYDPQKDLVPVIQTSSQPNVLAVSGDIPVKTVSELISYAKQRPGKLNYASVGNGSSSHLTMELFKTMTGSFIVHIPYNGAPPAALSLLSGETQMLFSVPSVIMPQIKAGKIKALAVTSPARFSLLPDLPTVAEAGLPGFESITWNGVLVPKGTPADIVQRLNTEIDAVLKQADVKARFNNAGLDTAGGSADAFRAMLAAEAKKWEPIIRRTGAKID